MRAASKIFICSLPFLVTASCLYWWHLGAPRRESLAVLASLEQTLRAGDRVTVLELVVPPAGVRDYSPAEQSEFVIKALVNEISADGLAVLRKDAEYGPLSKVFPAEAEAWATQAGVSTGDCVAFKLHRPGVDCEVVLVKPGSGALDGRRERSSADRSYKILRVNNWRFLISL